MSSGTSAPSELTEPGGVVLAGDAGLGKTRLASQALALAEGGGAATARPAATWFHVVALRETTSACVSFRSHP